jgi:hypothetical protein
MIIACAPGAGKVLVRCSLQGILPEKGRIDGVYLRKICGPATVDAGRCCGEAFSGNFMLMRQPG